MFIEILKTFIESRVEFKILHYFYPLALTPPPIQAAWLTIRFNLSSRVGCWLVGLRSLRSPYRVRYEERSVTKLKTKTTN